jgi:diguanylate cyclase (GGDEF)-like protein/PAS domain S-box-containing protein
MADGLAALARFARLAAGADFVLAFRAEEDGQAHPLAADPGPLPGGFSLRKCRFESLDGRDGPRDAATLALPTAVLLALDRPVQQALFLATPFEGGSRSGVLLLWGANRPWQCACPFRDGMGESVMLLRASFGQMMAMARLEQQRQRATDRFHDLLETVPTPIIVFDVGGVAGLVNRRAAELLGVPAGQVDPSLLSERMRQLRERCRDREALAASYAGLQTDIDYASTICWRLPGRDFEVDTHPILGNGRNGRIWVFHDITARTRLEEELRGRAESDPLTGLANRRRFFDAGRVLFGEAALAEGDLSVLMLDVDHFKLVNDRYGHAVGDEVLRGVSQLCLGVLRDGDILARIGGEEFAALLPMTRARDAASIAERLRAAVAASPIRTGGGAVAVTVSLGGAVRRAADATLDAVLRRADAALYDAKRTGRDRVVFDDPASLARSAPTA